MSSLRVLGRLAPRVSRLSTAAISSSRLSPFISTASSSLTCSSCLKSTIFKAAFTTSRSQHASDLQRASESQVNMELVAKIESELAMEKEMRDPEAFPSHLKEYIENSPFEIHDVLGKEEVVMTRKYGDELIKISFSIDDLNNVDEDPDQMQDENAMMDEMDNPNDLPDMQMDTQSGGANTKGSIPQGKTRGGNYRVAPQDNATPGGRSELVDEEVDRDEQEPSFPSHTYITVERPGKGALQIEAVAQDGMLVIENVYFYKDGKLADPKTRPDEEASRDLYTGPPFGNLDEDLQLLFEKYLEERGINTTLALFVPEYIDYKEQKEYLNWLSGVKSFVE